MFEEHKYEELKKLGTELHIPICEAFLKLEVLDKDGNLVQEHSQRGHSWVRNAYNLMFSGLAGKDANDDTFGAGKLSIKETDGSVRHKAVLLTITGIDTSADDIGLGYLAGGSEDNWGILVGSGTNAESFEDYALQAQIAEGTGAGQISHVASSTHSITYTAGTKVLKNDLIRYFNNNSGGSLSVNEVALVSKSFYYSQKDYYLWARDRLGATVTIADTGQLKVTYTIQITYPS